MADTENPIVKRLTSSGLLLTLANICYVLIIGIELTAYFYDNLPVSLQVLSIAICCIIIGSINSVVNQNSPNEVCASITFYFVPLSFFLSKIYFIHGIFQHTKTNNDFAGS